MALKGVTLVAGDLDKEAASWTRKGAPLGIVEELLPSGVSPVLNEEDAGVERARACALATGSDDFRITPASTSSAKREKAC